MPTRKRSKKKSNVSGASIPRPRRLAPPPVAPPTAPSSLTELLSFALPAGPVAAFICLGYLPKRDPRLDPMLAAYRTLPEAERDSLNVEMFVAQHGIESWEFLMWTVGAISAMGGNASRLAIDAMRPHITKASLERAMTSPEEAREWHRSWGDFVVPQKATVVVNANANAQAVAGASAVERGLPSFVDTTEEAEDALGYADDEQRMLPESSAVATDVPFTIRQKEIVDVKAT